MDLCAIIDYVQNHDVIVTVVGFGITAISIYISSKSAARQLKLTKYPQIIMNILPDIVEYNPSTGLTNINVILVNEGESAAINIKLNYQTYGFKSKLYTCPHLSSIHRTEEMFIPIDMRGNVQNGANDINLDFTITYQNIFHVETTLNAKYTLIRCDYIPNQKIVYRVEPKEITYNQDFEYKY